MSSVAFIGLGVMGTPMARHLAAAGHRVTVYNRTATKAAQWVAEHGGKSAPTPADAARGAGQVTGHRLAHHAEAEERDVAGGNRFVGSCRHKKQNGLGEAVFNSAKR